MTCFKFFFMEGDSLKLRNGIFILARKEKNIILYAYYFITYHSVNFTVANPFPDKKMLNIYYKKRKHSSLKQTLQVFPASHSEQKDRESPLRTIPKPMMKITRYEHAREREVEHPQKSH